MLTFVLAGVAMLLPAQTGDKLDVTKIPKKVMDTLKAKFPRAVIDKWTREEEAGAVVHDIEFKQDGRKFEADIKEDGTIHNWERQVSAKELPAAVRKSVQSKYPKSAVREVMAVTAVKDGKDVPEGYEILLQTAGKKEVEVTLSPDGKFLEDPGEKN